MPVLPAVASTMSPPGLISPRFSASRMICRAGRSFTDWPGFMNSALPRIVQPVAHDENPGLFVFGAVPMDLLAEMSDEAAGWHRCHIFFVDLVAGCHPPCTFDHDDEAVIGMEVGFAEISWLESVENHIRPVLGRIAVQHKLVHARRAGRVAPFVL